MCNECPWLPEMAVVSPWVYSGPGDTYEMLYRIFQKDFVQSCPSYEACNVWHFRRREDFSDGKENIFWHLTSRKPKRKPIPRRKRKYAAQIRQQEAERLPDHRRCERLPWIRPMIENAAQSEVFAWDYEEGDGTVKTYVWLKEYDFVVIMKKYPKGGRRLITSFYVDSDYTYKDFERKYAKRLR